MLKQIETPTSLTSAERLYLLKCVNNDLRLAQNKGNASAAKLTRLYGLKDKLGLVA